MENVHLEDQECGRITLRRTLGKYVVRIELPLDRVQQRRCYFGYWYYSVQLILANSSTNLQPSA